MYRTVPVPAPVPVTTTTAPINIGLSNKMWAQQVVANLNQHQRMGPPLPKEPGITQNQQHYDNTSFNDSAACRTLDETVAIGNCKEEDSFIQAQQSGGNIATTAGVSESTMDTAPDVSLSKLAKKRDAEAGLELAGRRARQKVRKKKREQARKKKEAKGKKERLKALEIEAKRLRDRAASAQSRLPKQRLRLRSRRNSVKQGVKAQSKKPVPQSKVQAEDLVRIQEAKQKTLQRLRKKRRTLRETEARQRELSMEKANEKWRVRDAKLALDQQRRLQRRRFLEAERKAAANQMAENAKILTKVNALRNPVSILKTSTQIKDPQIVTSTKSTSGENGPQQEHCPRKKVRVRQDVPPPAARAPDTDSVEADVSAVYEDVEAWVKSVYGGKKLSKKANPAGIFTGENAANRENSSASGNNGRSNISNNNYAKNAMFQQQGLRGCHARHEDTHHQQAADDQAFLDAILQATE